MFPVIEKWKHLLNYIMFSFMVHPLKLLVRSKCSDDNLWFVRFDTNVIRQFQAKTDKSI